jgi:hypothetical protein
VCVPLVHNGDDATLIDADLFPGWLRHVEVLARQVTPPTVVIRKRFIRRAKVCSCDGYSNSRFAERWVGQLAVTRDLVALSARGAIVEQHRAQRRCPCPVPLRVQVAIPARSTWIVMNNALLISALQG